MSGSSEQNDSEVMAPVEHDHVQLAVFVEAALLAAAEPLSIDQLLKIALARPEAEAVAKSDLREALKVLTDSCEHRGVELVEVASGFRLQIRQSMARQLGGLFEERPPRYSRAFFETLALIAYRQPITRGEIEDVRGVAVSSNIIRSMLEREWVRVVGHRDVPGKPAMFGTTKAFLDYFNLKTLDELPSLAELTDIESLRIQLDLPQVEDGSSNPPAIAVAGVAGADSDAQASADDGVAGEAMSEAETNAAEQSADADVALHETADLNADGEDLADADNDAGGDGDNDGPAAGDDGDPSSGVDTDSDSDIAKS